MHTLYTTHEYLNVENRPVCAAFRHHLKGAYYIYLGVRERVYTAFWANYWHHAKAYRFRVCFVCVCVCVCVLHFGITLRCMSHFVHACARVCVCESLHRYHVRPQLCVCVCLCVCARVHALFFM